MLKIMGVKYKTGEPVVLATITKEKLAETTKKMLEAAKKIDMKKLLLVSLMLLTSCSDRYDFVLRIESGIPDVNVESFRDMFTATYKEKTVVIANGGMWNLKLINQIPESQVVYVYDKDLETTLKKMFNIAEK